MTGILQSAEVIQQQTDISGPEFTYKQTLLSPNPQSSSYYGDVLAIYNDTIVVAAWGEDVNGYLNQGRAYVYKKTTATALNSSMMAYAETPKNENLFLSNNENWSIEFNFLPEDLSQQQVLIYNAVGKTIDYINDFNFSIGIGLHKRIIFEYANGTVDKGRIEGILPIKLNQWNRVVLSYDSKTKKISSLLNNNIDVNNRYIKYLPKGADARFTIGRTDIVEWDPEKAFHVKGQITDIKISRTEGITDLKEKSINLDDNTIILRNNVTENFFESERKSLALNFENYNSLSTSSWVYKQTLEHEAIYPNSYIYDSLGRYYGVSIYGNTIALGVNDANSLATSTSAYGMVVIYEYNVGSEIWEFKQNIVNDIGTPESGSQFGYAVSVWEDLLVFSEPQKNYNSKADVGVVHVYRKINNVWTYEQTLFPNESSTLLSSLNFGAYVKVFKNTIICGAKNWSSFRGKIYVFTHNGSSWTLVQTITAYDLSGSDYFGTHFDFNDDYLAVGSPFDDDVVSASGSVYVYKKIDNLWVFDTKITQLVPSSGDEFGTSVSINQNNILVISAHNDDDKGSQTGAFYVYIHDGTTWVQSQKLYHPTATSSDEFGERVAISGNIIVVGAKFDDDVVSTSGSALVFEA